MMAFPPVKLPFSFIILYFFLLSNALDMSIITYDHSHNREHPNNRSEDEVFALHKSWLVKHGKVYNGVGEKEKRFEIFKDNLKFIDVHNSVHHSYKLGLNHFADMTNEEYQSVYLSGRILARKLKTRLNNRSTTSDRYRFTDDDELPDSIDWRSVGGVAPVRNQGSCGSGWAFSAVSAVEGVNKITTGDMITLSEQELIDCDTKFNKGCRWGNIDYAFEFIINNGGIDTDDDYPYKGHSGTCDENRKNAKVVSIDSYEDVPVNVEKSLKKAVANQPVSVVIDARSRKFQFYKSGIYDGPCGTNLNQGVNVVGYGTHKGKDYWIVRNSWSEKWGEEGYIRLQRNVPNTPTGKCGIAMQGSYPVMSVDTVQ